MKFEIYVTNNSFDTVWDELAMLSHHIMGDMTLIKGQTIRDELFITVHIEEIADTSSLMKTLNDMANKGIHWSLKTEWWYNHVNED